MTVNDDNKKYGVFRSFDFGEPPECLDFVDRYSRMTDEERYAYAEEKQVSFWTLEVLYDILLTEVERLKEIKAQLEIEKDAQIRANLEQELQRMRLAKEFMQRDDRVVMCPVGSGWPSSTGMRGFESDFLCQENVEAGTQ